MKVSQIRAAAAEIENIARNAGPDKAMNHARRVLNRMHVNKPARLLALRQFESAVYSDQPLHQAMNSAIANLFQERVLREELMSSQLDRQILAHC